MKSIIAIALISLAFCGFINQEEVDFLKANAPFEVYEPEENPFRDYTEEQIKDLFTVQLEYPEGIEVEEEEDDVPESFDFRTQWPDCVGEIRNQASCGSCWAFSGAVAFQQRLCIAGGDKVVLSPQDSVSCDKANLGCQGGYLPRTWNYDKTTGLVTENCFPTHHKREPSKPASLNARTDQNGKNIRSQTIVHSEVSMLLERKS